MHKLLTLLAITLSAIQLSAQVRTGQPAPGIHIGEWVSNAPSDPSIKRKFVVLEFWATWCAPCIKAVPHLNDLQAKFANRKDLYFISISDEEPGKIRRTLQKVDMRSMVAADEGRKTFKAFGVSGIPHTVLIDNKGIVQWIGHPERLSEEILRDFLAGKLRAKGQPPQDAEAETVAASDAPKPVVLYRFEVTQEVDPLSKGSSSSTGVTPQGAHMMFENLPLARIISIFTQVPEYQIRLPDSIAERNYNVSYFNPAYRISYDKIDEAVATFQAARNDLLSKLLDVFGLQQSEATEMEDVFALHVQDASKLEASDDIYSHQSSNDGVALFATVEVGSMVQKLSDIMAIKLIDATGLTEKYNFHINTETLKDMAKSLEEYGLEMKPERREVKYVRFVPKN